MSGLSWKTEPRWMWPTERGLPPTLKISVEVPAEMIPTRFESDGAEAKLSGRKLEFSASRATLTSKLEYRDAKGKKSELHFVTDVRLTAPAAWLDRACADANLGFTPRPGGTDVPPFVIAGFRCEEIAKPVPASGNKPALLARYRVDVYLAADSAFKSSTLPRRELSPSQARTRGKPAFSGELMLRPTGKLGEIVLKEGKGAQIAAFDISVAPAAGPTRRWSLSAGVGFTGLTYKESRSINTISMTQIGVTPKIAGTYAFGKVVDVGMSVFGTAVPIYAKPESARFWGVNFRFGFTLPTRWLGCVWKVLPGWYTWGMLVSSSLPLTSRFGVAVLAGPQVVLSVFRAKPDSRPFGFYLKYAPTAESPGALSMSNREVAGGGAIRINSLKAKHRIDLTLDVSNTHFATPQVQMDFFTTTLGVQFDLSTLIAGK